MKPASIDFKEYLKSRWDAIYSSADSKFILSGELEKAKVRKEGGIYLLLNESVKKKKSTVDPKQNSVFSNFDTTKFNFNQGTEKQLLFYVNFDSEEVVTREAAIKETERFLDGDPEEAGQESENHPLYINTFPLCRNHSLLIVFPEEELPQVIGEDVILLILNIFKLSPDLLMGYNSLGAGASVNHLHVHLMYTQDLLQGAGNELPIAKHKRKILHKTSLVNPKQEVNMFSVGIVIEELLDDVKGFVLSPLDDKADQSDIFSSLSFVFGLVVNELLEQNIAHNVIFMNAGRTIYIIPRKFQTEANRAAWLEFAGVFLCKEVNEFNMAEAQHLQKLKELQIENLEPTKKRVMKHLEQYI